MESSYIGAYWGSRRESARECGERLARCISALGSVDPVLGSWFRRGASKAAAKTPVGLDAAELGERLAQGRNRRDFGGEVIEELGFSVGLWNRARPAVGLSATVGAYTSTPGVLNSFVLELPEPDDVSARIYQPEAAAAIFAAVVESWAPAWATWTTHSLRNAQNPSPGEPVVGWLTYLGEGRVSDVALPLDIQPFGNGALLRTSAHLVDVDESSVRSIRDQLRRASALRPIA
jgi:hypothetical protein